jgi:hypothetical protein
MHLDEVLCEFLEPARGMSGLDRKGIKSYGIADRGFLAASLPNQY